MLNKFKNCSQCKTQKQLSEFGTYISKVSNKNYFRSRCKECEAERLSTLSKQKKKVYKTDGSLNWSVVYRNIRKASAKRDLKVEFSKKEFLDWKDKQPDKCHYCKNNLKTSINNVKNFFKKGSVSNSKRFQIDRKNSNKNYTLSNICFACAICNTHKVDFYTEDEFLEIANKYIIPILNKY